MTAKTCIVLAADLNYLLPALVCAGQARRHAPPEADVRLYLDAEPQLDPIAREASARVGVNVLLAPAELIALTERAVPRGAHFAGDHLSRAALLRLRVADLVGPEFDRILYLDSDMQVRESLAPLLAAEPPAGGFLAVRDWNAYHTHEGMPYWEDQRAALAALGMPETAFGDYVNTGMMLGHRDSWRRLGDEALAFYNANAAKCRYYDQCAINAVAHDRIRHVSPRWNFLRRFMGFSVAKELRPSVWHFATPPKPWVAPLPPWGNEGFAPYEEMAERLAGLGAPWRQLTLAERLKYEARARLSPRYFDARYRRRLEKMIREDHAAGVC